MSEKGKNQKKSKPDSSSVMRKAEEELKHLLPSWKTNAFISEIGKTPQNRREERPKEEVELIDFINMEKILAINGKEELPSCKTIIRILKKILPHFLADTNRLLETKLKGYHKLDVFYFVVSSISLLPITRVFENNERNGNPFKDKKSLARRIEFAEELLDVFLSIRDVDVKAMGVECIFGTIGILETVRDEPGRMSALSDREIHNQRMDKCKVYQISPEIIQRAYRLYRENDKHE